MEATKRISGSVRKRNKVLAGAYLAALVAALTLALPQSALAQASAAINGTITDTTGAVVPNAKIVVTNLGTGVTQTATTNRVGIYFIQNLYPGQYKLQVSKSGFITQSQTFTLSVNQTATSNFTLSVGSTTQTVTVSAKATHLEASTTGLGTVINNTQVNDLPLNGRNFTQLLTLTPGASPVSVAQNSGGFTSNPVGTFSFPAMNGQSNRSNFFLLDGINDQGSFVSTYGVAPIVDAIQEFKVQSHNGEAEYGGVLGGIVNVVSKTGTNRFHGDLWEFLRNNALDARNPFFSKVTPFKQNQFGGTIGGPVIIPHIYNGRNKTFFFVALEGYRNHTASQTLLRVPTDAELNGDLSDIPYQIYNPFTTRPDPNNPGQYIRDPFPGNNIQSELDPGMVAYAKAVFPKPMFPISASGVNAVDTTPIITPQDEGQIRLDEHLNAQNSLWASYTGVTQPQKSSGGFPGLVQNSFYHGYNLGVGYTRSIGNASMLSLELGRVSVQDNLDLGLPNVSPTLWEQIGFSPNFVSNFPFGGPFLPGMSIPGFAGFTGYYAQNLHSSDIWEYRGDYSTVRGHHLIQGGADFNSNDMTMPVSAVYEAFSATQTSNLETTATTGSALASFLLGVPTTAQKRGVFESTHGGWVDGFYIQDQWKATPKLTVNLGFRYDVTLLPIYGSAADNNQYVGDFNFNNGTYVLARVPPACSSTQGAPCIPGGTLPDHVVSTPLSNHAIIHNTYDNWQPRLGLAYMLGSKTVLRAGIGRFFDNWAGVTQTIQGYGGTWPTIGAVTGSNLNTPTAASPTPTALALDPLHLGTTKPVPAASPFRLLQRAFDPLWRNPYSIQWNTGFQRLFGPSTILSMNYVGSENTRVDIGGFYNTGMTAGTTPLSSRQPYSYIIPELYDRSVGRSNYNALQTSLRRNSTRFTYLLSYTWSKSMDYGCSGLYGVEGCSVQDPYNMNMDYSVSTYDLTNIFSGSFNYRLPFGAGAGFRTNNPVLDQIIGHWQLNNITTLTSGTPYTINIPGDTANIGNWGIWERPNLAGNPILSNPTPREWFNKAAFALQPFGTFGTAGRNILRSNWYKNVDLSIFRSFPIHENTSLQFRADFFNSFNDVVWGTPVVTLGNPSFGSVLSIANHARQIQFALKLFF